MSMFFLTPAQQAAKDAEEARLAAELKVLQEAAQGGVSYGPVDTRVNVEAYKTPEQLATIAEEKERIKEEQRLEAIRVSEQMAIADYQQERREEDFDNLLRAGEFEQGNYEEVVEEYFKTDRPDNLQTYVFDNLEYREDILGFDDINFDAFSDEEKIYSADVDGLLTRQDVAYISGYESPTNLGEAKERADSYYIQSLERNLENATTSEEKEALQELINKGAPNFNTIEDIKNWESLESTFKDSDADGDFSVDRAEYDALKLQADVVGEWASQPNQPDQRVIGSMGNQSMSFFTQDILPKDNYGNVVQPEDWGHIHLNTGTAYNQISSSLLEKEKGTVGGFGEYTYIEPTFDEPSKLQKWIEPIGKMVAAAFPQYAPIIATLATSIATDGDIGAGLQSGATTLVQNKITDISSDKILDAYEKINIPVKELSDYTQSKVVDFTVDVLKGDSGTESFKEQVASLVWNDIKNSSGYSFDEVEDMFEGWNFPDLNLPDLPDFPDLNLPNIDLPEFNLPDLNLPDLPEFNLPDLELPEFNLPDLELPELNLPELNLPDLPELNLPDLELPELNLPDLELPELDLPDLNLPDIELPELNLPDLELPELDLNLPELDLKLPDSDL